MSVPIEDKILGIMITEGNKRQYSCNFEVRRGKMSLYRTIFLELIRKKGISVPIHDIIPGIMRTEWEECPHTSPQRTSSA